MTKKQQTNAALLRGQKYKYEECPEWYAEELTKNVPINISKFGGDLQSAVKFYLKQVNKLYFANTVLNTQLTSAIEQKNQLSQWIQKLQQREKQSIQEKKKRVRRCASQIQRKFICQVINCDKSYGTQGSMAQHMRLKHPQIQYNGICSQVKLVKKEQNEHKVACKKDNQFKRQ